MAESILFYAFAGTIILSALFMVGSRNIFHSALWLALCLFGVAAIFVMLDAYFLAGIQVLIYIGAVVVLSIFVINLTRKITGKEEAQLNKQVIPAFLACALGLALIILAVLKTNMNSMFSHKISVDETAVIGRLLLGDFVLPFEVVSILLLVVLIGAVVVVSRDAEDDK